MSLDLIKVISQVSGMVARLKAGGEERQQRLQCALDVLHHQAADLPSLKKKLALSKTTWLVAGLVNGLDGHYTAPTIPQEFTVMATDGSHIDIDRHRSARCYLVNIGSVILRYGADPRATLDSAPRLYFTLEDLVIKPGGNGGREQLMEGTLLGIKRAVDECQQLVSLATQASSENPNLALLDGSLILWGLEAYPEFVSEAFLNRGFLHHLEEMRLLSHSQPLALASYISFPRSTDVVNVLRVALCPQEVVDSDRYCSTCVSRECDAVAGIQDRDLFSHLLSQGERSATFVSQSSTVRKHYGQHQVHFFYLKVNDEIARIEIPGWVATEESRLSLAHTLIFDQCQRGHGYPVALSEAHEKAVISGADRESFWQLVETSLMQEHMPCLSSAKSRSKRTRWI